MPFDRDGVILEAVRQNAHVPFPLSLLNRYCPSLPCHADGISGSSSSTAGKNGGCHKNSMVLAGEEVAATKNGIFRAENNKVFRGRPILPSKTMLVFVAAIVSSSGTECRQKNMSPLTSFLKNVASIECGFSKNIHCEAGKTGAYSLPEKTMAATKKRCGEKWRLQKPVLFSARNPPFIVVATFYFTKLYHFLW